MDLSKFRGDPNVVFDTLPLACGLDVSVPTVSCKFLDFLELMGSPNCKLTKVTGQAVEAPKNCTITFAGQHYSLGEVG